MLPTVTIPSLKWAGLHETLPLVPITPQNTKILRPRQDSQDDSEGSHRDPPVTRNNGTAMAPPGPSGHSPRNSPIPGLSRSVAIVVIVVVVMVFILAIFVSICCWRRRKINRPAAAQYLQPMEVDLELPRLETGRLRQFNDTPRPDSTTLPIQEALSVAERTLPPIGGNIGSPLESMLNRFNTINSGSGSGSGSRSGSHRRLGSEDSGSSNVTWDNGIGIAVSTTPSNLPGPSNYQEIVGSPTLQPASPPPAILRSPIITSFTPSSPRISSTTKGKQPIRHSRSASESSATRGNKLRKKKPPVSEKGPMRKSTPSSPLPTFGTSSRAGVSWWESSSDEEGDSKIGKNKRGK